MIGLKCDELTPIDLECNMGKDINGVEHREPWNAYDIDEVNAAIAELKAKLEKTIAERDGNQVCIDALKQGIYHHKYKRCMAMAERWLFAFYVTNKCNDKFYLRSLKYRELAKKFKELKNDED